MLFEKRAAAVVLSKGMEEVEDPPVVAVAGANPMLTAAAMQDESKSMWRRDTVYSAAFRIKDQVKEFFIDRSVYDRLEEGDEGILVYSGSTFVSFEPSD